MDKLIVLVNEINDFQYFVYNEELYNYLILLMILVYLLNIDRSGQNPMKYEINKKRELLESGYMLHG